MGTIATKGDRTRRRLLDAAAAEVARAGIGGVSLGGIAAAAGLKTGSIYFHFTSKDDLVATMLEEGLRESLRHLEEALPDSDDPGARLRAAVRGHLGALVELDDYATVVLSAGAALDLPAAEQFRALRLEYLHRWTSLIADAQRAGVIATGPDPRLVRDLLIGAMNAALRTAGRSRWSLDDTAAAIESLLQLRP